jgi:hypothetical protein
MKTSTLLGLICAATFTGCVHAPTDSDPGYAGRMKEAGDGYLACMTAQAEKDMKNPAGAEDIAVAAHGRCWAAWDNYRKTTAATFLEDARTPQEQQLARDKADAHLRQFEREARRSVMDSVVERSLRGAQRAP